MIKHNQDGAVNGVTISLIFTVILFVAALGFGMWAFASRQDYKANTDDKIADAVKIAKQQESTAKDKQFVEKEKFPLRSYNGPADYGSVVINYPKTWSAYVSDSGGNSSNPVDGYFHPSYVPATDNENSTFALKVQVSNTSYSQALTTYQAQQKSGEVTITPYTLPKVPKVVGVRVNGQLQNDKTGTIIILPLRAGTLQISTDGTQYLSDFDNTILPNISFSP